MPQAVRQGSVPLYKLSISQPIWMATDDMASLRQVRENAADLLAERASDVLQRPIEDIVIRDILPGADLALNSGNNKWISPALTANAYTTFFSQQLPVTQLMSVYGAVVLQSSPTVTGLKFLRGTAQTIGLYNIEAQFGSSIFVGSITRPNLIWNPQDTAVCQLYATATTAQWVVLLGFIAEPVGINVNPPSYITGGG